MRISDWSSDVCSSDLGRDPAGQRKCRQGGAGGYSGIGRCGIYEGLAGRSLYARRQHARYWRRYERNPAGGARPSTDRHGLSKMLLTVHQWYGQAEGDVAAILVSLHIGTTPEEWDFVVFCPLSDPL